MLDVLFQNSTCLNSFAHVHFTFILSSTCKPMKKMFNMSYNEGLLNYSGISFKNLKMQYEQSLNKICIGLVCWFGLGES